MWKGDISVSIEVNDFQSFHMKMKLLPLGDWVQFTSVHGSPFRTSRKELWPALGHLAQSANGS